jgi:hypothetical protein
VTDRVVPGGLLDDDRLHTSSVVANCAMNRERQLTGVNSYARDLGFDPLELLTAAVADRDSASWLDLCCGTGRALIQAAEHLHRGRRWRLSEVRGRGRRSPQPARARGVRHAGPTSRPS